MDKHTSVLAKLFRALGDPTRLRILGLLLNGEVCVCDIHDTLRIPQPKASRHLAYLRRAGLVATRREGLWVHYRLASVSDPVIATLRRAIAHALGHFEIVRKDGERLQKRTGCCTPVPEGQPLAACCSGGQVCDPPQAGVRSAIGRLPVPDRRKRDLAPATGESQT